MPDQLYFAESIIRSHVRRLGWNGFLVDCFQYSCRYLMGFTVWIVVAVAVHLAMIGCFMGFGFQGNQQPNPAARLWVGLLLFPFAMVMGFFVRFVDSKTWEFRETSIAISSVIVSSRVNIDQIRKITIEEFESHEVWRIEKEGDSETQVGVFLKTKHNQKMKARLFGSGEFDKFADLVEQVG